LSGDGGGLNAWLVCLWSEAAREEAGHYLYAAAKDLLLAAAEYSTRLFRIAV
jgi:hypothetical protein